MLHNEHKDQLDELLAGKNENIPFKVFKAFDKDEQSFLKEKLYLELPQAS